MTMGGTGFYALSWIDQQGDERRIAYLRPDPHTHAKLPSQLDCTVFEIFELLNQECWVEMVSNAQTVSRALQRVLDRDELKLVKIVRSIATGKTRLVEYDLAGVTIREVPDENFIVLAGKSISNVIEFHSPRAVCTPSGGLQLPLKETKKSGQMNDHSNLIARAERATEGQSGGSANLIGELLTALKDVIVERDLAYGNLCQLRKDIGARPSLDRALSLGIDVLSAMREARRGG